MKKASSSSSTRKKIFHIFARLVLYYVILVAISYRVSWYRSCFWAQQACKDLTQNARARPDARTRVSIGRLYSRRTYWNASLGADASDDILTPTARALDIIRAVARSRSRSRRTHASTHSLTHARTSHACITRRVQPWPPPPPPSPPFFSILRLTPARAPARGNKL